MSDPFKLRAMGLLVAAGFIGGLFAQYQAPGHFLPPPRHAKTKKHQLVAEGDREDDEEGDPVAVPMGGSPNDPEKQAADEKARAEAEEAARKEAEEQAAAEAKRQAELKRHTPEVQRKYAAIATLLDNTIQVRTPGGGAESYIFAPRGLSAEIEGDRTTVRIWTREDDRLCQQLDAERKECFSFVVRLEKPLQDGPDAELHKRIEAMPVGARIGSVEGIDGTAVLVRGNVTKFPGYVPLMDPHPNRLGPKEEEVLPGALLTQARGGEDSAATYFGPAGQLLEVTREKGTKAIARLWRGSWSISGDRMCRDLPPGGAAAQECSRVKIAGRAFEFPDADPSRRRYQRIMGAEEMRRAAEQAAAEAEAKEQAEELRARAETQARMKQSASATLTLGPSSGSAPLDLGRQRNSPVTDLR